MRYVPRVVLFTKIQSRTHTANYLSVTHLQSQTSHRYRKRRTFFAQIKILHFIHVILNITSPAISGVNAQRMTDRKGMLDVQ